jgi:hypothetical protein
MPHAEPLPLKCPCCDAPLTPPAGRGNFYCQFCGTPVVIPGSDQSSVPSDPKPAVAIPDKLRVEELGGELRITWKWFTWGVLFLIPFCIAWNAFLVGWYSMAVGGHGAPGGMQIIMLLFPIAHVAVGLGLLYFCLLLIFNRTVVRVSYGQLELWHGPLPVPGNHSVPVDDIAQLYVAHEHKRSNNGNTSHTYPLIVRLKSGKDLKLMPSNSELDVARALEQLVEEHLGIRDESVSDEHRID